MFYKKPTKLSDLDDVTLKFQDDALEVGVFVEVGSKGERALYTETIEDVNMGPDLRKAVVAVGTEVLRVVNNRRQGDYPCAKCRGACCYSYKEVHVTEEDIVRMGEIGQSAVTRLPKPTMSGFVGVLKQKPRKISGKTEEGACIFLRDNGCAIYERRPVVCREYDAFTCEIFEEDHKKVGGKVKLRVLGGR